MFLVLFVICGIDVLLNFIKSHNADNLTDIACGVHHTVERQGEVNGASRPEDDSRDYYRNLCIAQIVLVMRISSWNFVRVRTRTNFQIEILNINVISGVVYFRENILGSSRNVSETAHWFTK